MKIDPLIDLPEGATIVKSGRYTQVSRVRGHPLANSAGRIPYHRFVLYEKLGRPESAPCWWCGYVLPFKTDLEHAYRFVVCADHLDGDVENNSLENIMASCWWCNANRQWAEQHPTFWAQWRKWMKFVPPAVRPNLISIALELGLTVTDRNGIPVTQGESLCLSPDRNP